MLMWPVTFPISKALDYALGDDLGNVYTKKQMVRFLQVEKDRGMLMHNETTLLEGALTFGDKTVLDIMTPLSLAFCKPVDTILDFDGLKQILSKGHSRVPIFKPKDANDSRDGQSIAMTK